MSGEYMYMYVVSFHVSHFTNKEFLSHMPTATKGVICGKHKNLNKITKKLTYLPQS